MSTGTAQSTPSPRSSPPQRPRPRYSLYDDIRCTGENAPQSNLPMEVVCNIFDYANFTCAMSTAASSMIVRRYAIDATLEKRRCEKKLCPWTIKEGWKHTYLCSRACFKETCVFQ